MTKEVLITFDAGTTTIETKGFKGRECQAATKELEAALGMKTADTATGEMYATGQVAQTQQARA